MAQSLMMRTPSCSPHALVALIWALLQSLPTAAEANSSRLDVDSPSANAVAILGGCSATLIAPDKALAAAHCFSIRTRGMDAEKTLCPKLSMQANMSKTPDLDPYKWHKTQFQPKLRFGADGRDGDLPSFHISHFTMPLCGDMVLLRLSEPVPADIAIPIPVVTGAGTENGLEIALIRGPLRHAGFGRANGEASGKAQRSGGRVSYWGQNDCHLYALPPNRANGRRINSGDSGAPLILRLSDGRDVIMGVMWGRGNPDGEACGLPSSIPPENHGSYTATFRGKVQGTQATDIGDWLSRMVPEAAITLP